MVQNTLNLLRKSRINPNILAYEALNGLYNWDRYPLAPPSCKAFIYETPAVWGSWASIGTDAWYLGLSKDHYRCNLYYVPVHKHIKFQALQSSFHSIAKSRISAWELKTTTALAVKMHKGCTFIHKLKLIIYGILNEDSDQRVRTPSIAAPPRDDQH